MYYYVIINRLNGRNDYYQLGEKLNSAGYDDRVEYFPGGWVDNIMQCVKPHLRFTDESGAIVYCLATGSVCSKHMPVD